ncbi:MAG TPA: hypothetical protein ENI89_11405 [Desulfobulbus sp.]|nr:hypothetical protein [Desulfobulbus sp.]
MSSAVMSVPSVITEPVLRLLLLGLAAALILLARPGLCEEENGEPTVEVKVVAVLTRDEQGEPLRYPSAVFSDHGMDETYVVAGGKGKVVVYGPNFFPVVSLAAGRGAESPRGVFIDQEDNLYICQGRSAGRAGRITVYNPAFFPVREIGFRDMPGGGDFSPLHMVIGLNGNLYVTGLNSRGVAVFDHTGRFLHWLQPRDRIVDRKAVERLRRKEGADDKAAGEDGSATTAGEDNGDDDMSEELRDLLPPSLRPRRAREEKEEPVSIIGPVKIVDVARDSSGHLYLLSEETSRVYVYSPAEEFLFAFGRKGGSTGKMSRPKSLVIDEKKKAVYIVDYMRHTILIFDLSGVFMYEFGGLGNAPGWFQYPSGLALNRQGQLLVADLFNHRVQVLDVQFEYRFPLFQQPAEEPAALPESPRSGGGTPSQAPAEGDVLQPRPL